MHISRRGGPHRHRGIFFGSGANSEGGRRDISRLIPRLRLETREFLFPIHVCYGCLCQSPPGIDCQSMTDSPDKNCEKGQDIPVDCRFAPGGKCP